MKRTIVLLFSLLLVLPLFTSCGEKEETVTLNVYNWGEYISDGSEDSFDVNAGFEEYYKKTFGVDVEVNYTTYSDNESMYNKLKSGAAEYDIVIPSEYMIERMISEDMLLKLNFDNIPNYKYIDENYKNLPYDPNNEYSVPYTYGMVGLIYNSARVKDDVDSWSYLWNEKYSGDILQFNNPRDAFGTAMYYKGIDVNTTSKAQWDTACDMLLRQKPLVQSYVMDEIFNKMKNGSATIAPYYAGDFLSMYESNEELSFAYPKEGTNVFVDAMCVPSCSENKEIAERYINYMLSEEPAIANAEYIYYASPNTLVYNNPDYIEYMESIHEDAMEILYPKTVEVKTTYYENLSPEFLEYQNELWEKLKIDNSVEPWVYVVTLAILGFLAFLAISKLVKQKIRSKYY